MKHPIYFHKVLRSVHRSHLNFFTEYIVVVVVVLLKEYDNITNPMLNLLKKYELSFFPVQGQREKRASYLELRGNIFQESTWLNTSGK